LKEKEKYGQKMALCCTIFLSTVILQIEYLVRTDKYQFKAIFHVEWIADGSEDRDTRVRGR